MSLFQNSVLNKYLRAQNTTDVDEAWQRYTAHFFDPQYQHNVRASKEEQYQEGFLRDLFVQILGYTLNPKPGFNLTTELKNIRGAKKTDGAILREGSAIAVIELKGTDTVNLDKVEDQAFGYKRNQPDCSYVITSNFEKLRFYIDDSINYIDFPLFQLTRSEFDLLYLCLSRDSILTDLPKRIKTESVTEEEAVTKKLYKDYSAFRREIFDSIVQRNPDHDKLTLFKSTQKLLDRFLFIFFAEDRGLLPPNSIRQIINQWTDLRDKYDEYVPLYERFKKYFGYLNTGHKGAKHEIFAYNGGLFATDDLLDNILIDDDILYTHSQRLSDYDFESEVSVNILGHIFEHSLNEIEEIQAEIDGQELDIAKTKRKKDGVFYTPKYITKYIVDHTVGKLCEEQKSALQIEESEYDKDRKGRTKKKLTELQGRLEEYRSWLLTLTICDPACGSGAFLNQALEYLIAEHQYIDTLQTKLFGGGFTFPNVENAILEHNLYGVDINQESVEIAKLSLWLRTAQRGRKLTSLNDNIKCGNSLIDDPEVAGDKAFKWEDEFPEVFANGGFDVVIGNPPYKAGRHWADKDESLHNYLSNKYNTADYQLDLYVLFYERSLNILRPQHGLLSFITPNTWFTNISSKGMRDYILTHSEITQILDCSKVNVFQDAVVETAVVTMKSEYKGSGEVKILQLRETQIINIHSIYLDTWRKTDLKYMNIYVSANEQAIKDKLENRGAQLGTFCEVRFGVKIYEVGKGSPPQSKKDVQNRIYESTHKINSNYLPLLQGRDINRYNVTWNNIWIRYGPNLAAPRSMDLFSGDRILVRRIMGNRIIACWLNSDMISNALLHVVKVSPEYSSKAICGILSSKLMAFYHKKHSGREDKAFPEIKVHELRNLPVAAITHNEQLEKLITQILNQTSLLGSMSISFLRFLQSKYPIDKLSKKLQRWYDLDFGEFLAELKKKKVKLSLQEEAEWMPYFEEQRAAVQDIRMQIDRIDAEIDQMVYQLYGLTEEEIAIVEEAVG